MRTRTIARVLLLLVAMLALTAFWVSAWVSVGCCSMDPERYPAAHAAARRRGELADQVAIGALVLAAGSVVAAVWVARRRN